MLASDPTLIFSSRYDEGPQLWQRLAISGAQGPPCIPLCSASLLLPLALPFHQHVNMLKTLLSLKTLIHLGASLGVLWLRLCSPTAGAAGSIPGQGTKIPQAKKKKKNPKVSPIFSSLPRKTSKRVVYTECCGSVSGTPPKQLSRSPATPGHGLSTPQQISPQGPLPPC